MLGREIKLQDLLTYTIVGLTDLKSPSIYMNKDNFTNVLSLSDYDKDLKIISYDIISPKVTLKEGRIPTKDYEAIHGVGMTTHCLGELTALVVASKYFTIIANF